MSDDKKPATLLSLPGGGATDAMLEGLRNLKKNAELFKEYWEIEAGIRRAKYLAHLKAGFTEAQALELTK